MPIFSITPRERTLSGTVKETISASPSGPKPWASAARPAPVARAASSGRAPVNEERLAQLMAQVPHGRPPQGGAINRKARDASKMRAADEVDLSKAQRV